MFSLFADVAVTPMGGALVALSALAAFLGGKFLFQKDTEVEARRKAATRLASQLRVHGFKRLPRFVENYAAGDYSGMVHELKSAAEDFSDEKTVKAELDAVLQNGVEAQAKDPETRDALYARIEKLKLAYPVQKPQAQAAVAG